MFPADPNTSIVFENMVAEWGGIRMAELSVVLVHLRFLTFVHQTHHWVARGDSFYGDHQLFQRLYDATVEHVDALAEKAVGLAGIENVNISLQTTQLARLVSGYGMMSTIPQTTEIAKRSLAAEVNFIKTTELALETLKESGQLTKGLDNLLAGLLDVHESHIYLLKQRACS